MTRREFDVLGRWRPNCESFGVPVPCWFCDLLIAITFFIVPRVAILAFAAIWLVGAYTVGCWLIG